MVDGPGGQGNRFDEMRAEAEANGQILLFAVKQSSRFNEWSPSHLKARFTDEEDARRAAEVIGSDAYVSAEVAEVSFEAWYARTYQTVSTTRHVPRR